MRVAASIAVLLFAACGTTDPAGPSCDVPGYIRTIEVTDTLPDGTIVTALGEALEPADCDPGVGSCVCLDRWLD